ncbi:PAS domain-containing protein [Methyloceanibacter superfactus]|uniref:PAS domain-containing protein n=1 Tax=Methyloceanibacter superfactus TaxID=1774969 RepID=UPI0009F71BDF
MASKSGLTRNGLEISRSEFVLESTTDSVIVLDRDWRILYRNRQALDLLRGRDLSLGRSLWEAFPEAFGGPFHKNYEWALKHQKPVDFEDTWLRWRRGSRFMPIPAMMRSRCSSATSPSAGASESN